MRKSALLLVITVTLAGCVTAGPPLPPNPAGATGTAPATEPQPTAAPSPAKAPATARSASAPPPAVPASALPNAADALKFIVFGDFGVGDQAQYRLAAQMAALHTKFPFEMATLVGDNIYGSDRPQDYKQKFEIPYRPLLEAGVKFYGALGNHDAREQRFYELFNMKGELFYSFKAPKQDVRFFALESTYMQPEQVKWLEAELQKSGENWKIVFFHHPLYSSGVTHGSDERLRATLEPLFVKYGVSVVLAGHDHLYERTKPQQGITHFVTGSGGKLRPGDYRRGLPFSAIVVDNVNVFLAAEISGDEMVFNAIATSGRVVDSGKIERVKRPPTTTPVPEGAQP